MSGKRGNFFCDAKTLKLDDVLRQYCGPFASPLLEFSSSGMSLLDGERTHSPHFPFPIRHGRKLIKGQLMSLQIPHYNPTQHTEKTTTSFILHSLQCCSRNPSSLSLLPLPWPLVLPPPQPHLPLAKTRAQTVPIKAPVKTRIKAPFKAPLRAPVKPPPAARASTRCAVMPSPHSPIFRIVSRISSKPWTPH
ncbi:hypothetical protein V8E53_013955 [Lactarius tabidus]